MPKKKLLLNPVKFRNGMVHAQRREIGLLSFFFQRHGGGLTCHICQADSQSRMLHPHSRLRVRLRETSNWCRFQCQSRPNRSQYMSIKAEMKPLKNISSSLRQDKELEPVGTGRKANGDEAATRPRSFALICKNGSVPQKRVLVGGTNF